MPHHQLSGLNKLSQYRETRSHIFPSDHSMQWFVRINRQALIEAGALIMLAGQWHADADKFDTFVVDIGRRNAQKHRTTTVCA